MTTRGDLTDSEWALLTQVPPMVALAVANAAPHSLLQLSKELRAVMVSFRGSIDSEDELVAAIAADMLSTERMRDDVTAPDDTVDALSRVLGRLEQVEALLSVKAPGSLPSYARLVLQTARATAEAVREKSGTTNISDEEQAFLDAINLTFT